MIRAWACGIHNPMIPSIMILANMSAEFVHCATRFKTINKIEIKIMN